MSRQRIATFPSAATRADSSPYVPPVQIPVGLSLETDAALVPASAEYDLNFTALGSDDIPISQGGTWLNNTSSGMNTNTSMQVRLATDGVTLICCDDEGPHFVYEDSIGIKMGHPGKQRVEATIYRASGYSPSGGHELELYLGAEVFGNNNKRCIQVTVSAAGEWAFAVHDGQVGPYNTETPALGGWVVVYSAVVLNGTVPQDGDVFRAELDPDAKTCEGWLNNVKHLSTQWNTTHDEIDTRVKNALDNLGDGIGLAMIRRSGATEGALGFRRVRVFPTLLG